MILYDTKNDTKKNDQDKKKSKQLHWRLMELEAFFRSAALPEPPIVLNPVCVITNVPGYIKYHLEIVKVHNGKEVFLPYLHRLTNLKS